MVDNLNAVTVWAIKVYREDCIEWRTDQGLVDPYDGQNPYCWCLDIKSRLEFDSRDEAVEELQHWRGKYKGGFRLVSITRAVIVEPEIPEPYHASPGVVRDLSILCADHEKLEALLEEANQVIDSLLVECRRGQSALNRMLDRSDVELIELGKKIAVFKLNQDARRNPETAS